MKLTDSQIATVRAAWREVCPVEATQQQRFELAAALLAAIERFIVEPRKQPSADHPQP